MINAEVAKRFGSEHQPIEIMKRYLDGNILTNEEREILLFALYVESKQNKGIAYIASKHPLSKEARERSAKHG